MEKDIEEMQCYDRFIDIVKQIMDRRRSIKC